MRYLVKYTFTLTGAELPIIHNPLNFYLIAILFYDEIPGLITAATEKRIKMQRNLIKIIVGNLDIRGPALAIMEREVAAGMVTLDKIRKAIYVAHDYNIAEFYFYIKQ